MSKSLTGSDILKVGSTKKGFSITYFSSIFLLGDQKNILLVKSLYKQVLRAQTSTLGVYASSPSKNNSGLIYGAVPKLVINYDELLAKPKSAIFKTPYFISIFSGLISLWVIWTECK